MFNSARFVPLRYCPADRRGLEGLRVEWNISQLGNHGKNNLDPDFDSVKIEQGLGQ